MPPEFEWIKPGVKVVDIAEDCPICADVYEVAAKPRLSRPYGAWLVKLVGESGFADCETIIPADKIPITLTMTREQAQDIADILGDVLHYGPSKELEVLKEKIEEKLK